MATAAASPNPARSARVSSNSPHATPARWGLRASTVHASTATSAIARCVSMPITETSSGLTATSATPATAGQWLRSSCAQIPPSAAPVTASASTSSTPAASTGCPVGTMKAASSRTFNGDVAALPGSCGCMPHTPCSAKVRA